MSTKKSSSATHNHAALEAEIAKLKKEVAALKKQCSAGGSDPRLSKLIDAFKSYSVKWKNLLESAGL